MAHALLHVTMYIIVKRKSLHSKKVKLLKQIVNGCVQKSICLSKIWVSFAWSKICFRAHHLLEQNHFMGADALINLLVKAYLSDAITNVRSLLKVCERENNTLSLAHQTCLLHHSFTNSKFNKGKKNCNLTIPNSTREKQIAI